MSKIEWTEKTWNPVVGCTPVSTGCLNCYAASMSLRLEGMGVEAYQPALVEGDEVGDDGVPEVREVRIAEVRADAQGNRRAVFTGSVRPVPGKLLEPLGWKRPWRVFVCSMADLFHEAVEADYIARVFAVMALTPRHTYQVLTKRPDRMAKIVGGSWFRDRVMAEADGIPARSLDDWHGARMAWPLRNVWLGTSVEDQRRADERIPKLLDCPAAVRFLSCEPLLQPLDLSAYFGGEHVVLPGDQSEPSYNFGIDWVIAGGESGPHARPMHPDWARSVRDQCVEAGVAFFFKQWGGTNKKAAGRVLDGRTWDEMPARGPNWRTTDDA